MGPRVLLGLFGAGSRVRPLTLRVPLVIVESRVSLLPSMQPMRTGREYHYLGGGTYTLTASNNGTSGDTTGLPVITSPLTIQGAGAETTIMERDTSAPEFRLLKVAGTLRFEGSRSVAAARLVSTPTSSAAASSTPAPWPSPIVPRLAIRPTSAAASSTPAPHHQLFPDWQHERSGIGGINNQGTLTFTNSTLADNTSPAAAVFSTAAPRRSPIVP